MTARLHTFTFSLPPRAIVTAMVLVASVGLVLGAVRLFIGPHSAQAAYLAVLLLISPARALRGGWRFAAAGWAIAVALLGFVVGSHGLWAVLVALTAVCLVQGLFRVGGVAAMTRAPVNLLAFAALSTTDVRLWQVALGSIIGATFVLAITALTATDGSSAASESSLSDSLRYGAVLAAGSLLIVAVGEWVEYPYVGWALLSFCTILAVGLFENGTRARDRLVGTAAGAVVATVVSLVPQPVPLIAAVVCSVLCFAYLSVGNYTMFVTLLTPAILLTTSSDQPTYQISAGRIGAVLVSVVVAVAVTWCARKLMSRRPGSPTAEPLPARP
ncbi:FUSC family protein [Prescottella defluvii]|uniref:FUSC family protein n=1 Tax=Prescottella defluvii TaxID=1323361 RepID=UPI000AFB5804|nr:FUSC family protein [Prescottella defluvii]